MKIHFILFALILITQSPLAWADQTSGSFYEIGESYNCVQSEAESIAITKANQVCAPNTALQVSPWQERVVGYCAALEATTQFACDDSQNTD